MLDKANETGRFRRGDSRLLIALASGQSIRQAAHSAALSEATICRRLDDPGFRRRLNAARLRMVDTAIGSLAAAMTEAADALRQLLKAKSEMARLGAARAILELHARLCETAELERRVAELEGMAKQ